MDATGAKGEWIEVKKGDEYCVGEGVQVSQSVSQSVTHLSKDICTILGVLTLIMSSSQDFEMMPSIIPLPFLIFLES